MNPVSIALLGRQPALGLVELESLLGADAVQPFGNQAALLTSASESIPFKRLGGSIRIAQILTPLTANKWQDIHAYLLKTTPEHAEYIDGKLSFGISVFGFPARSSEIARTALLVKKALKATGKSVRMVPHTGTELSSATVLHNKLTRKNGWELIIVSDGKDTYLAQTTHIQDIDAYSRRDQARPARDAKVGMLPPKLAQIIINMAVGKIRSDDSRTVLDPFCGTGVVLQEALLMGYGAYGTDLEPRMIDYSSQNLEWLTTHPRFSLENPSIQLEVADATSYQWKPFDIVACETFLGKPLANLPPSDQLSKIIYEANKINHTFLQNLSAQMHKGQRACIAVPVWRGKFEFLHLPMLDHLTEMGYTRVRFEHASTQDLVYHRENQVVGRELLVLEKVS